MANVATIIRTILKSRGITGADAEAVLAQTLEALQAHVVEEVEKSAARRGLTVQEAAELELGRSAGAAINKRFGYGRKS